MNENTLLTRPAAEAKQITEYLRDIQSGHPSAQTALFDCVYTELHRLARGFWRGVPPSDTLQPTALVHEMYVRIFHDRTISWENRRHFFCTAATAMHDIIVEQARRHGTLKRGGHLKRAPGAGEGLPDVLRQAHEVAELEEAFDGLKEASPDAARVVMLKLYGGLGHGAIAEIEGIAEITVRRRWAFAKAWLRDRLDSDAC